MCVTLCINYAVSLNCSHCKPSNGIKFKSSAITNSFDGSNGNTSASISSDVSGGNSSNSSHFACLTNTASTNLCLSCTLIHTSGTSGITHFSNATNNAKNTETTLKNIHCPAALPFNTSATIPVLNVSIPTFVATDIILKNAKTLFQLPKPYEPIGCGLCDVLTKLIASTFISKILFNNANNGVNGNAITNNVTYPNCTINSVISSIVFSYGANSACSSASDCGSACSLPCFCAAFSLAFPLHLPTKNGIPTSNKFCTTNAVINNETNWKNNSFNTASFCSPTATSRVQLPGTVIALPFPSVYENPSQPTIHALSLNTLVTHPFGSFGSRSASHDASYA
mmetsp:Transcript_106312/g.129645  ORF Transcript_106312/g.129645 Transcript_106312/m.129645 type:complete len:339 (+) Transcript_106312:62-1078(+)